MGLKYDSFVPSFYKTNFIKCFIYKAFRICSTENGFLSEINFLRSYFCQNKFPLFVLNVLFRESICSLYNCRPHVITVPKRDVYFFLIPFLGVQSYRMKRRLSLLSNISILKSMLELFSNPATLFKNSCATFICFFCCLSVYIYIFFIKRDYKGHLENKSKIGQERSSMQQADYHSHRPTPWMLKSVSMHKSPTPLRHSRINQARSEEEEKERQERQRPGGWWKERQPNKRKTHWRN